MRRCKCGRHPLGFRRQRCHECKAELLSLRRARHYAASRRVEETAAVERMFARLEAERNRTRFMGVRDIGPCGPTGVSGELKTTPNGAGPGNSLSGRAL